MTATTQRTGWMVAKSSRLAHLRLCTVSCRGFHQCAFSALNKPQDDVFLIIDEINRGNCAAIFGDVFQLLDRVAEPGPEQGHSRYSIQLDPVILDYCSSKVSPQLAEELHERGLRIPNNMHLLATMNTSDQSLFPMDSAFKRRWEWEYVPINYQERQLSIVQMIEAYWKQNFKGARS